MQLKVTASNYWRYCQQKQFKVYKTDCCKVLFRLKCEGLCEHPYVSPELGPSFESVNSGVLKPDLKYQIPDIEWILSVVLKVTLK